MATAPPPCRPGLRAHPSQSLAFPSTVSVVLTFTLDDTPLPLAVIAGADPRSPKRQGAFLNETNPTALAHLQIHRPFLV